MAKAARSKKPAAKTLKKHGKPRKATAGSQKFATRELLVTKYGTLKVKNNTSIQVDVMITVPNRQPVIVATNIASTPSARPIS